MKILKNGVYNQLDANQPEEQTGFKKGHGTTNHIHTIFTESQVTSLQKTQRAMERSIPGIKLRERKNNKEVRRRTKAVNVSYRIKKKKFQFAGHSIRGKNEQWAKNRRNGYDKKDRR